MTEILKGIPTDAWMVLAIATAGLILLIGVRICRKGLTLRKRTKDGTVTLELEDDPNTPAKPKSSATSKVKNGDDLRMP